MTMWGGARSYWVLCILVVMLALAAGCRDGLSEDPYAGTWQDSGGSTVAVIAAVGESYRVTVYGRTLQNVERTGDRLHAWTESKRPDGGLSRLEAVFTRDPDSDGLVFTDPLGPGLRRELMRASDATTVPSPWPP